MEHIHKKYYDLLLDSCADKIVQDIVIKNNLDYHYTTDKQYNDMVDVFVKLLNIYIKAIDEALI